MTRQAMTPGARWRHLNAVLFLGITVILMTACGKAGDRPVPGQSVEPAARESPMRAEGEGLIRLTEEQVRELNVQVQTLIRSPLTYRVSAPGEVQPAPGNVSVVSAPVNGRVATIYAHEGERVRKGQPLLELESLEFANLVADYLQANAEDTFQKQQLERIKTLVDQGISPRTTLERIQMDYDRARASNQAAVARLRALGVLQEQMTSWQSGKETAPLLQLRTPITGTIDEHLIDLGQAVNAYDRLLSVVNRENVLIRGYVSPDDAAYLKPGDSLTVYPQKTRDISLSATIATINPALDKKNKSIVVNVVTPTLANHTWPIPGQAVIVEIWTTSPAPVIAVPVGAVTYTGKSANVFVQLDAQTYRATPIEIRQMTGKLAVVSSGLQGDERIAVTNVFGLKALSRMSEYAE